MSKLSLRTATEADLALILRIQAASYPNAYQEGVETFRSLVRLYPDGCRLAGEDAGYIFSHPWRKGEPRPLNTSAWTLPAEPNCLYLHDLAIHPDRRSQGTAQTLVDYFFDHCRSLQLPEACLTAVQGSAAYWERHGFRIVEAVTYGGLPAFYMARTV